MADEARGLVPVFEAFRDLGIVKSSPLYDRLNEAFIEEPELAAPLLAAPPTERYGLLLFAAVQYLLRRRDGDAELAAYYPSLGGTRAPDGDLVGVFREFVTRHAEELRRLTATRVTQTNEARRAAVIRPALAAAQRRAGERAMALVEVGCSSGLMLLPDRYGYRYTQPDGSVLGFGEPAAPELALDVEVRGGEAVPDWVAAPLRIASRVGIDRNPIPADDADQTEWLRACVWPEHVERLARLDAALAEAREARLDLRTGDLSDLLPAAVADAPPEAVVVVLSSHVLPYMAEAGRRRFAARVAELARTRDLLLVLNENRQLSADIGGPEAQDGEQDITLSLVDHTAASAQPGERTSTVLAKVDAHGSWLEWL